MHILVDFDQRVITHEQIQRILHQLEHIVLQINTEDQQTRVGDIEFISLEDKMDLRKWNQTRPDHCYQCVHTLVEQQALLQPDRPAICSWDGNLTYRQLDDYASRLARQLLGWGVEQGAFVPLLFEKSMWTLVSMLAILKAGGACVPMDPSHPISRLEAIIGRLHPYNILTSESFEARLWTLAPSVRGIGASSISWSGDITHRERKDNKPKRGCLCCFHFGKYRYA